jgi:hypothetical protein
MYVSQNFESELWINLLRTDELIKRICKSDTDGCPLVELVVMRRHRRPQEISRDGELGV